MSRTTKIFDVVFKKYDALNASVQENVSAIRVVKAMCGKNMRMKNLQKLQTICTVSLIKAEKFLSLNGPVMMFVIYFCIIALSWFGAKFIVVGDLTTGELTSMFSYIMGILNVPYDALHDIRHGEL